ncbi:MAG TPA: hypothetical protein VK113_11070 [Gemmatimonadales bacterium]|nr:hypothetical protein [Gemmatimonadales bacterium]
MKALAAALLVFVAACGQGRAIFNVDVLSFLSSSDSLKRYSVPGGIPQADSAFARRFYLPPGFGKSAIDSVSATAAASVIDTSGSGSVRFDVFFAKTQAAVFAGTPYVTANSRALVAPDSVALLPPTTVSLADTVFNTDTVWVGVRARISTNIGPNMAGRFRLTTLRLRIVVADKLF